MILCQGDKEVTVKDAVLASDLLIKWGYDTKQDRIEVKDIDSVTAELSAWGIPWKRTKWNY